MNAKLSARILSLIAAGHTLPSAIDAVLGAGEYDALIADLYLTLRRGH